MEVKPGYKKTEVGVIPEEWDVRVFGQNYAEPSRNGIYKPAEFQGRGTRIVNMGEMFGFDFISDQEISRVALTPKEVATTRLSNGDLLFGRRSVVPAGAGKCSLVVEPTEPLTFESSIIRVRLNQSRSNPLFHYYFFASPIGRDVMSEIVSGTNVKGIRGSELRKLKIPHPSLPEQCAIAEVLSDVDDLLGGLDQLVAKKRELRQAAMHQLLTGQTRFPGFQGEWETKRIGDIATSRSERNTTGDRLPVLACSKHVGFVDSLSFFKNQVFSKDLRTYKKIRRGEIGYPANHVEEGSIGLQNLYEVALVSPIYIVFRVDESVNSYFLHRVLKLDSYRKRFKTATSSSVDRRGSLRWGAFSEITVHLPPTKAEQAAVAEVLTDMDEEIAALEQRLEKTRSVKQAMMQELLTGRIRLV
jgi:type I restriction enzyme, S subunit